MSNGSVNKIPLELQQYLQFAAEKMDSLKHETNENANTTKSMEAAIEFLQKSNEEIKKIGKLNQEFQLTPDLDSNIKKIKETIIFFTQSRPKIEKATPVIAGLFYQVVNEFKRNLDGLKRGQKVEKGEFDAL